MIDLRYKPRHLPQISIPFDVVMDELNQMGIENEIIEINPDDLNPMQGIVFSDEVGSFDPDEMKPIWISKDNDVIDGHHRYLAGIMSKKPIIGIRVGLNGRDAARELNRIQDIYEYEQQRQMEEVVTHNTINKHNEDENEVSTNEFLASLEEMEIPEGEGNVCKLFGYRQKPIMENSVVGNFFMLKPMDGYDKYEIDFENLLDTSDLGIQNDIHDPIDSLASMWFPNIDFENMSEPYKYSPQELKNKAIVDRAKKMGYDGIKYGDTILQGLK
jgi:hypothetical protein